MSRCTLASKAPFEAWSVLSEVIARRSTQSKASDSSTKGLVEVHVQLWTNTVALSFSRVIAEFEL
jgi:hypothetical protein